MTWIIGLPDYDVMFGDDDRIDHQIEILEQLTADVLKIGFNKGEAQ